RVKPHFHRVASVLLAFAVFVPTIALLGVLHGVQEVAEKARLDPAWMAAYRQAARTADPVVVGTLNTFVYWFWGVFAAALVLVLLARAIRTMIERRGGSIRVIYPDGRTVRIPPGLSV